MRELSLHILDIVQNAIAAGASLVTIEIHEQRDRDLLSISVTDDGCGMPEELRKSVSDPFTTTRSSRKVGLGIPMMKASAIRSGGDLSIRSELGKGTELSATYRLDHIDRPPLGDIAETMITLVAGNPKGPDFVLHYRVDEREYAFDTRPIRSALGEVPLTAAEVLAWMRNHLKEGIQDLHGGAQI
ncbi:MAG: ATP-binding protein [Christensenellales bacterium]|jgi:hypothetical protein